MPKTLRDLIPEQYRAPTFRDFAEGRVETPVEDVTDFERGMVAAMPGDDISQHPAYRNFSANPFRGRSPQEVLRMLKEGTIESQAERKQAMEWINLCERCGEKIRAYRPDG
jgi:hypothetical protein